MKEFITFVIIIIVFVALPKIIEALQRAQAEATRRQRGYGEGDEFDEGDEEEAEGHEASKDEIQEYLERMGVSTRPQQRPVQPPAPQRPKPQPQQPQRRQYVHGTQQRVPQHAAEETARAELRRVRQQVEQPVHRVDGTPVAREQNRKAKAKPAAAVPVIAPMPAPSSRRKETVDLMAPAALKGLTPVQKAIIMADILGQPKSLRDDDVSTRWS